MSGHFLSQAAVFWQTQDWIRGALAALRQQNSNSLPTHVGVW